MARSEKKESKSLYLISPSVRELISRNNPQTAKFVNCGLKAFVNHIRDNVPCDYRMVQEGTMVTHEHIKGRKFTVPWVDLIKLLDPQVPHIPKAAFTEDISAKIEELGQGSCIVQFDPDTATEEDRKLAHATHLFSKLSCCAWIGRGTLTLFIHKTDLVNLQGRCGIVKGDPSLVKPKDEETGEEGRREDGRRESSC
eukprot:TRINITY_DN733_c0_g1_i3.p1 TRINITY_DN733_c0_g1~~TRINITY_DN733_c0_g1_i3.p1  ORF type:complete len:197 (+),score=68.71 TRINITY_DN733_c0_g1_i3:230-820(+)